MKRVMCVFLPAWPLQRLARARPELRDKPLALAAAHESRPTILFRSQAAARAGVRPGMPVAEAVALNRTLVVEEEDPAGDVHALEELAAWAERYCPHVGLEEGPLPRSLLLDVTGCAGCFGGEDNLRRLAEREFAEQGWVVQVALADTVGAAWALAHHGRWSLHALPVAALRLPDATVGLLHSLGIERVGQLEALPRASLPARFGSQVLRRLDQLFGRVAEVIESHRFLPDVHAAYALEYPATRLAELHQLVDRLAGQIHAGLQERNRGARQVECWLYHEAASPQRIEVGLSRPNQSDRYLAELLRVRLEQTRLAAPVSGLSLRVTVAEPPCHDQAELFDSGQNRRQELAALIDRLGSRLGRDAVARAVLVPDPQPEHACRFESWLQQDGRVARPEQREGCGRKNTGASDTGATGSLLPVRGKHTGGQAASGTPTPAGSFSPSHALHVVQGVPPHEQPVEGSRPLRLREPVPIDVVAVVPDGPPLRFAWGGVDYVVTRSWGPERIEAGWWRGQDVRRDYYVVATQLGSRFWVFRRRADGQWWLHGSFD